MIFKRYDYINNVQEPIENYSNEQAVIEDATRFYHEHFTMEEDYDENFKLTTFKQANDFWLANGYEIRKIQKGCMK